MDISLTKKDGEISHPLISMGNCYEMILYQKVVRFNKIVPENNALAMGALLCNLHFCCYVGDGGRSQKRVRRSQ